MTQFISQALMYLSPIIYPISQVPESIRWLANLNPLAAVIESYRYIFLGASAVDLASVIQSVVITVILLLSGLTVYNRIQRNFVDYS
jgi:lipopolysaccharide transport system permease protein